MILIHPSIASNPARIAELVRATGKLAVIVNGRAQLVSKHNNKTKGKRA